MLCYNLVFFMIVILTLVSFLQVSQGVEFYKSAPHGWAPAVPTNIRLGQTRVSETHQLTMLRNYDIERFYDAEPKSEDVISDNRIYYFSPSLTARANKLECLSLTNFLKQIKQQPTRSNSQTLDLAENVRRDKHSSLFCYIKMFYNIATRLRPQSLYNVSQ